jgi:hypothetical protein
MLLVPVVSSALSIPLPDRPAHAPVRYSDLVEFRAFCPETQPLVESLGGRLRVQVHLGEASLGGEFHEATHDRDAGPGAAVLRQHCDAPNLTRRLQASRANYVTFYRPRMHAGKYVHGQGVLRVPLVALRDALFLDKNGASYEFETASLGCPVGDLDNVLGGHCGVRGPIYVKTGAAGPAQTSRASRAATPM